jgi:L-malate glycosyltransferase
MRRRRICFVGWGGHVHVERWAGHFARAGDEVSVISFGGLGRYPPGVRQLRIGGRSRGERWARWRLAWLLWRLKPDLVHVHWAHFAVPVRAVWAGPLVVSAWGSDIYRREAFSDGEWARLGQALRASELLTSDSHDLARTLVEQFEVAAERVAVIQWGVDTDVFCPEGPDLRDEYGLAGREVVFSARNFTRLYNQDKVIAAFDALARERPAAFLLMKNYRGDAQVLAQIRGEIAARGLGEHVRIVEEMPYEKMPALYRSADVTLSIPSSDAAPMSVLEAMACGCPTVVCDLPSLREWVSDGETGLLVDPTDIAGVTRALRRLLDDAALRAHLRQKARDLVVSTASQRVHMAAASARYDELCRSASARR